MLKDELDDYLPKELQDEVHKEKGTGSIEQYEYRSISVAETAKLLAARKNMSG